MSEKLTVRSWPYNNEVWDTVTDDGRIAATFYIDNAQHNANLWAQHYPALLEAVREYRNCARILLAAQSRINAERYDRSERDLNDAMKACEPPPRKTREDVLRDVFRWLGGLDDDENVDINTLTHKTLRELDEAGD